MPLHPHDHDTDQDGSSRWLLAAASAAAGIIHVSVILEHRDEAMMAVGFALVAWFQLATAYLVLRRPGNREVLGAMAIDDDHLRRGDALNASLDACSALGWLRDANSDHFAAMPIERGLSGQRLAESGRRDLERVAVGDEILDVEDRADLIVDRDAVVVRDPLVAVDDDSQHRPSPLPLERPTDEVEPLGADDPLDDLPDLFVFHTRAHLISPNKKVGASPPSRIAKRQ